MAMMVMTTVVLFISILISTVGRQPPLPLDISTLLAAGDHAAGEASGDFGGIVRASPAAVFYPSSPEDIAELLRFSYSSSPPFSVAARGRGHSVRGQALAPGGVVVEMSSLASAGSHERILVYPEERYVDAGGEQMWVDVLAECLRHGLAPPSWTDYLHLTVGGTLSNAGIGGHAFLHGPQISNVNALDVITGKGEIVTCSESQNPELFFAVLGGLGQFGIITRARIALLPAPDTVKWIRMVYTDFTKFTNDQETLIRNAGEEAAAASSFDYVEGSVIMDQSLASNWRSTFFSSDDLRRISELAAANGGVIYSLEAAKYYYHGDDDRLGDRLGGLRFVPGFVFSNDVPYLRFLERVNDGEKKLRSLGMWDVPHPWMNIFVPGSRILDVGRGLFEGGGELRRGPPAGPILVYPMNKSKWDHRMSAVVPDDDGDEEVFYAVGLLRSAMGGGEELERLEEENAEVLRFLGDEGIEYKQYLPHFGGGGGAGDGEGGGWKEHFGGKWERFVEMKRKYDPRGILSPGQRIFTSLPSDVAYDR